MLTNDCPHFFLPILLQRKMKSTLALDGTILKIPSQITPPLLAYFVVNMPTGIETSNVSSA